MMRKRFALFLALVLVLTLAACGGGSDTPSTGTGGDTPLTRDDGSTSTAPGAGAPDISAAAPGLDMGAIMSGSGTDTLLSSYDEATRQAMIEDAKEDGYDMSFGADGSMKMENTETGEIIVQNPDGTWDYQDADGAAVNVGGDWPDNEFTKLVPKPEFAVMAALTEGDAFTITFTDATIQQIRDYTEQVKAKGFNVDAETEDQEMMGMVIFTYIAKNTDGYEVEVFSATGMSGITVRRP